MRIKQLRLQKGLSQKEFAKRLGVSQAYVAMIEAEKRIPTLKLALKIAAVLGTPVEQLFSHLDNIPQLKSRNKKEVKV